MTTFGRPTGSTGTGQPQTPFGGISTASPLSLSTSAPPQQPPAPQQQLPNAFATPAPSFGSAPAASTSSSTPAFAPATTAHSAAALRFRELAQQSQKLNESIRAGSPDLPKLELNLGMIRDKARDMSRRAGGGNRETIQQAYTSLVPI